jgi:hypothetical protein
MNYPKDVSLAKIRMKAVHNSYGNAKKTVGEQLTWNLDRPYRGGCCGLEFDLIQNAAGTAWSVQHGSKYSSAEVDQLETYLGDVDRWSADQNSDHPPIFLHFDVKNAPGTHADFAEAFDDYIRSAMPNCEFYSPGNHVHGADTLLEAGIEAGWPTVGEVWGHVICCISGNQEARKSAYVGNPLDHDRLCFVDRNVNDTIEAGTTDPEAEPNRVFYNFRYDRLATTPQLIVPWYRPALIFRAFEVNDWESWDRAKALGVNLFATDQVFVTKWALAAADCPLCPI